MRIARKLAWAYEFVPTSDTQIQAVDRLLDKL